MEPGEVQMAQGDILESELSARPEERRERNQDEFKHPDMLESL